MMASAIETIHRNRSASAAFDRQASGQSGFRRRFVVVIVTACNRLAAALERRSSRRALLEMTDDQLKDIGISRADAHREGLRSFFD